MSDIDIQSEIDQFPPVGNPDVIINSGGIIVGDRDGLANVVTK